MKFGDIIKAAGFKAEDYPDLKYLPVICFDRKERRMGISDLFPFFEKNICSKERFEKTIKNRFSEYIPGTYTMEDLPRPIEVKISYKALGIFFPDAYRPAVFPF